MYLYYKWSDIKILVKTTLNSFLNIKTTMWMIKRINVSLVSKNTPR